MLSAVRFVCGVGVDGGVDLGKWCWILWLSVFLEGFDFRRNNIVPYARLKIYSLHLDKIET
jgi:hypothetical protein